MRILWYNWEIQTQENIALTSDVMFDKLTFPKHNAPHEIFYLLASGIENLILDIYTA